MPTLQIDLLYSSAILAKTEGHWSQYWRDYSPSTEGINLVAYVYICGKHHANTPTNPQDVIHFVQRHTVWDHINCMLHMHWNLMFTSYNFINHRGNSVHAWSAPDLAHAYIWLHQMSLYSLILMKFAVVYTTGDVLHLPPAVHIETIIGTPRFANR